MALIKTGIAVGQISGRIAGNVFSRNRGGAYVRNGAIPTRSTTPYATAAKARLSDFSKAWASLTEVQQMAWKNWATQNPVINRLGDAITLSGHQAFVQLNININNAGGTAIVVPPVIPPPIALLSASATYDIGAGSFEITFTPDPLGSDDCLAIEAAVVDNPGVNYVSNLYKLVSVEAAATASPVASVDTLLAARFGTILVGQRVFYRLYVLNQATGLKSQVTVLQGTVIST